jgi:hypothetical protein
VTINGSQSHKKLDFIFKPGVQFDRLEVVFDQGVVSLGVLGDALRIYEVSLAPSLPHITVQPTTANSTNVCEGSTASFDVTAVASGGSITVTNGNILMLQIVHGQIFPQRLQAP